MSPSYQVVCLLMLRGLSSGIPSTPRNKLEALGARSRFGVQQGEQDEELTEHELSSRRIEMSAYEDFA